MTQVLCRQMSAPVDWSFAARARRVGPVQVVVMSGELDLSTGAAAIAACTAAEQVDVEVEMGHVGFMDCAGYRALLAAHTILVERGGSLVLTGPVGEPLRLLSLIELGSQAPNHSLSPTFTGVDGRWSLAVPSPDGVSNSPAGERPAMSAQPEPVANGFAGSAVHSCSDAV